MSFWDTEPQKPVFDFESEKAKLKENMDYLMTMSVQEQTLYKKWVELQEPTMIQAKSQIASYYDFQWKPPFDTCPATTSTSSLTNLLVCACVRVYVCACVRVCVCV